MAVETRREQILRLVDEANRRSEERERKERRADPIRSAPLQTTIPTPTVADLMKGGASRAQAERIVKGLPASPKADPTVERLEQARVARAETLKERRQFDADFLQLPNGEFVRKAVFKKLSREDQDTLRRVGSVKFNAQKAGERRRFLATHLELQTGEFVPKAGFDKLSSAERERLMVLGTKGFRAEQAEERRQFLATHIELHTGEFVTKEEFDKLSPEDREALVKEGTQLFAAKKGVRRSEREEAVMRLSKIAPPDKQGRFDLARALGTRKVTAPELRSIGFEAADIEVAQALANARPAPERLPSPGLKRDTRTVEEKRKAGLAVPEPTGKAARATWDRYTQALQEVLPSIKVQDQRIMEGRRTKFKDWQGSRPEVVALLQTRVDALETRARAGGPRSGGVSPQLRDDLEAARNALIVAKLHNADTRLSSETDAGAAIDALAVIIPVRAPIWALGWVFKGGKVVLGKPVTAVTSKVTSATASTEGKITTESLERLAAGRPGRIPRPNEIPVTVEPFKPLPSTGQPSAKVVKAATAAVVAPVKAIFTSESPSLEARLVRAVIATRAGLKAGHQIVVSNPGVRAFEEDRIVGSAIRKLASRGFGNADIEVAEITIKNFLAANRDLPLRLVRKDVELASNFMRRPFAKLGPTVPRGGSGAPLAPYILRGEIPESVLRQIAKPVSLRIPPPVAVPDQKALTVSGERVEATRRPAPEKAKGARLTVVIPADAPPSVRAVPAPPTKRVIRVPVVTPLKPGEVPEFAPAPAKPRTVTPVKPTTEVEVEPKAVPTDEPLKVPDPKKIPDPLEDPTPQPKEEPHRQPPPRALKAKELDPKPGRGRLVPPFLLLPGRGGKPLPRGVWPKVIQWAQGATIVQRNLLTGSTKFKKNTGDLSLSPRETLRVIETSNNRPKRQRLDMGKVDVLIDGKTLRFVESRDSARTRERPIFRKRRGALA